jgi:PAS domain S-box-containing protein
MGLSLKKIVVLIIIAFLSQNVYSQRYFIKTYDIENGLPTRMVYDICQDTSGLIWLATYEGISCYDGFRFMNYNSKDGIPEQKYKHIKVDEKGIIWCLPLHNTDTLVTYNGNEFNKFLPVNKYDVLFGTNDFDVMYVDNKPVICVGTDDGMLLFNNNTWSKIDVSDIKLNNIVDRVIADNGKFYLSTESGLCVLENGKLDWSLNEKIKGSIDKILTIEIENKGKPDEKLWVLSHNCLGYIENGKFVVFSDKMLLPDLYANDNAYIKFHSKGKIFVSNNWAKYYIDRATGNIYPLMTTNGFSSNGALSIFIDDEENIWFSDTRGVDKFNRLSLVNYFESNGLLDNEVTAVTEMNDGRFVLGHNYGLSILSSDNTVRKISFNSDETMSSRVHDMIKDKDGNVWFVAGELGVGKLSPDGKIKWYRIDKKANYFSIQQDTKGRIWVGAISTQSKLFYIENDKLVEYSYSNEIRSTIRKIFPRDDGGIYIVGIRGLWLLQEDGAKRIPSVDSKKSENVYSYFKNKEGIEFVGTSNGLYFIENGQIVKYNKDGVNITSPVYFIIQDRDGFYWLGSNDGVYKWDGKSNVVVLNTRNGLAGHETNRAAGIVDSKGRVWIGTDLGLSCFDEDYKSNKIPVPRIMFYDLEDSKGVQYYLDEKNFVPYIDNTLIFNFRGISYVNEDLMVYRYKLEGYDEDWQEIKQSILDKVKYIDVRPGDYKFSVMAKNFSGEWSEVKTSGTITIESPFYKSWWFVIFAFLIFGVMVGSLVKIKDQKYQNSKLEKEIKSRKRIEQDLYDSKKKYQDIVELLPEAIYETDNEGRFTFANSYGLKLLNFTQDDLKRGVKVEDIIVPEEQDFLEENRKLVFEENMIQRIEYTCLSKDGKRIPLSVNAVPILKDGKTVGIRGVALDMTESKKVQEALMKYADDLQSLNASKDKFFSIVAHDLKNPFQGLLGFSDFLHTDYEKLSEDERKEYIGYIRSTSKNAYNLLENLLQWSRLQSARIEVIPMKLNLFSAINSVMELFVSNAIRKRISVSNNADTNIFVNADSNMLNSILQNLISNAIKFTNQNGEIKIDCELKDGFAEIKVTDNGTGMDNISMNKLFRIDQHLSGIGTMKETGTGLGLILCKEMIELNGGVIKAESEKGKGSTFSFTIPLA